MGEDEAEDLAALLRVWRRLEDEGACAWLPVVDLAGQACGRAWEEAKRAQGRRVSGEMADG